MLDRLDQQPVSSADATLAFGSAFTPAYSGGSGIGAWQFAVAGYTNWDVGTSGNSGTNTGSWVASWTPPAPGAYNFWVARNGDGNYKPSGASSPYNLYVAGYPTATIAADQSTINVGQSTNINASFLAGSYDTLAGTNIDQPEGTPAGGGQDGTPQPNRSFTFTPAASGDYSFSARIATPFYTWATYATTTVHVNAPQSVFIDPSYASIREGEPITLTASGGHNGYIWGGSAAGGGNTQTVSFSNPGDYTVTAYSPAGGIYPQSNTATASLHVIEPPAVAIWSSPAQGIAPLTTTIYWSASSYSVVSVTGPGVSANYGTGSQAVVLGAGTYTYAISADGDGGHATDSTTVTVAANTGFIAATPASVDFGNIYRDSLAGLPTSGSQGVTFKNMGNGPVTLTSLAVTAGSNFTVSSNATLPITLAPNATLVATVTAGPGLAIGPAQGAITAAASSNSVTVPLTALGLAPILSITWTK